MDACVRVVMHVKRKSVDRCEWYQESHVWRLKFSMRAKFLVITQCDFDTTAAGQGNSTRTAISADILA